MWMISVKIFLDKFQTPLSIRYWIIRMKCYPPFSFNWRKKEHHVNEAKYSKTMFAMKKKKIEFNAFTQFNKLYKLFNRKIPSHFNRHHSKHHHQKIDRRIPERKNMNMNTNWNWNHHRSKPYNTSFVILCMGPPPWSAPWHHPCWAIIPHSPT